MTSNPYNNGNNDECYTPAYAVDPIVPYVKPHWVIWCPFDTEDSEFVQVLGETNKVIYSYIKYGQNFLNYEPDEHYDVIISNPTFTNKRQTFELALALGKPFALMMSVLWLNDKAPYQIYKEAGKKLQLLLLDDRIEFNGIGKVPFAVAYYCSNFLPDNLIVASLDKP
jgi:hypothetical protein